MNKFFKLLGIGSVFGVVAYGIIKYKHDEKFKEKVDTVVDKAADFAADHPILTTVAFTTAVMVPVMAFRAAMDPAFTDSYDYYENNDVDEECERINDAAIESAKQKISEYYGDEDADLRDYLVVPKSDYEKYQKVYESTIKDDSGWKEDYRDSFDEVTELSKRITLHPGESYMIEEPRQFGLDTDRPIVSHLINGTGCYPPEVKDDQFID